MQSLRVKNLKRLVIPAGILLAALLILLFNAQDVVREVVVLPLSYWFWVIGIFIRSTPQMFFWAMLLVVGALIAIRSLAGRRAALAVIPGLDDYEPDAPLTGRVSYWVVKLDQAGRPGSGYFRVSFHTALGKLLIEMLAHRYRLPVNQVEDRLRAGLLDVPDEVRDYALGSARRLEASTEPALVRLWQTVIESGRAWLNAYNKKTAPQYADPLARRILQYMQDELEVSNDDSGH